MISFFYFFIYYFFFFISFCLRVKIVYEKIKISYRN
nr:MAG TPA: hypothetical protein [Bacteriophage sp.]